MSKIGVLGSIFIIVGLTLFVFGFPMSLLSEVEKNNLGYFQKENSQYQLQLDLSAFENELYVVAEFDGKTRRDSIENITVLLKRELGKTEEFKLSFRRSGSNKAIKSGWYGKKVILGYFQINNKDKSQFIIEKIGSKGTIDNLVLSLHENSNRFYEGFLIIFSILLFISGFILVVIDIIKSGYNKLLKRTLNSWLALVPRTF
ncbi:MAG: hypothetical protein ACI8UG_001963 [Gammaproteobacteria bacterium]